MKSILDRSLKCLIREVIWKAYEKFKVLMVKAFNCNSNKKAKVFRNTKVFAESVTRELQIDKRDDVNK